MNDLAEVAAESEKTFLGEAMDRLNECFQADGLDQLAERVIMPGTRAALQARPPSRQMKEDGTPATIEDWVKVDLLARTLVGEIASTPDCPDADVKAVARVIMNRMEYVRTASTGAWRQFAPNREGDALINVITHKRQFSALNGKDNANRWFACPSSNIVQKYNFSGNKFATGTSEYINWVRAIEVASEMVFRERTFRESTREVTSLFYSKGAATFEDRKKQGFRHVRGRRIDGRVIDNVRCVQLWDDPRLPAP